MTEGAESREAAPTEPNYSAVLDSNTYIDIVSVHDLLRAPPEKREMRVERLREAALLAICFHECADTTYSLREAAVVLYERVPADSGGFEEQHIKVVARFLYSEVLPRWRAYHPNDIDLRGNAADRHLTDFAIERGLPLITKDATMTEKAVKRGARVFSPRDFRVLRKMDEEQAVKRFFGRFKAKAPPFARSTDQPRQWRSALDGLYYQYRRLLLGR